MWRTLKNAVIYDGEDEDEENTDDKIEQGSSYSAKGGKMKGTVSRKNLMSQCDDDHAKLLQNQSGLV